MKPLKEMLQANLGKRVVITAVVGGHPLEAGGTVTQKGDELVLVNERRDNSTPIGQDPRTGNLIHQHEYIPQYTTYVNDLQQEQIFTVRIFDESVEEAKAILSGAVKSNIITPPPAGAGVPSFVPQS